MARLISVVLALGLAASSAGCDVVTGSCGEDLEAAGEQLFADGVTEGDAYRSSDFAPPSGWLPFPAGIELRLEHDLAATPTSWSAFVATSRDESLVQASGEEVELVSIDDEAIVVRNPSCSDLVIVVTAER